MQFALGGVRTHVRESALKVDSGRKIPSRTGESNLCRQRAGPMLYQLSYIPIPWHGSPCLRLNGHLFPPRLEIHKTGTLLCPSERGSCAACKSWSSEARYRFAFLPIALTLATRRICQFCFVFPKSAELFQNRRALSIILPFWLHERERERE